MTDTFTGPLSEISPLQMELPNMEFGANAAPRQPNNPVIPIGARKTKNCRDCKEQFKVYLRCRVPRSPDGIHRAKDKPIWYYLGGGRHQSGYCEKCQAKHAKAYRERGPKQTKVVVQKAAYEMRSLLGPHEPLYNQPKRKCRKCGGPTGQDRYFNCRGCESAREEECWTAAHAGGEY